MEKALSFKVAVLASALAALSCCFPQAQPTTQTKSAKHFVEGLYSRYGPTGNPANLLENNANEAFDHTLIALANADAKLAKPDIGVLDYDPVCNCQDTDATFPNLQIAIKPMDSRRASATVSFLGYQREQNKIVLTLLREKGLWRIFNIEDLSRPGHHTDLRSVLKADIQNLSSNKAARRTQR